MTHGRLLLLVALCLWGGLVGGGSTAKIVRRRGLGSAHSQLHGGNGVTGQWDTRLEKNGMQVFRLKELIGTDKVADTFMGYAKSAQNEGIASLLEQEEPYNFNAKSSQRKDEESWVRGLAVDGPREPTESRRNSSKIAEAVSKRGRADNGLPAHHKIEPTAHLNRTRFRSAPRSRGRTGPGALNNAMAPKGTLLDSPHKLNLSGSYGVLKLISKDNLVRIVNSQLQNGLNFQHKISHSRKRDLIDMDRSQPEEPEMKTQDKAFIAAVSESENHNSSQIVEFSSAITNPSVNPDQTLNILWKPSSEITQNSREEEKKLEQWGATTSWWSKHYTTHVASTPQSDLIANTEASPFNRPALITRGSMLHTLSETDANEQSGPNVHTAGREFGATQDPGSRTSDASNSSHILKLHPNPDWRGGVAKEDSRQMTVDTGPGQDGRGLVFQEIEVEKDNGWSPKEGEGSRSRSRRSWIWNQFFVIEEYAGPEPVLIGRLHTDMDRGDGRTKYVLRGEGAGSVFVIDEKTGNIHVTKPLDREEKDEYRLIATATDSQTDRALEPSSQFIIRVQDINDNPPVFEDGPYSATVPEMANIGTSIIQVTATDADDPTYGNSARLVYTLVQGQPHFSVDPQTGILRTAVPDLDRETQDQYLVVLQAKDMGGHLGGLSGTTTVTVRLTDVNDNPPRFTQSEFHLHI
ncbi:uncharacterized protein LOC143507121 [Brachyhypopomus gauderio]|uniref:uncharacterized protein LOC143507121 n=1 Tax=Brachyhypopomus gauderio TaxID=698409 RepID=UPI004043893D